MQQQNPSTPIVSIVIPSRGLDGGVIADSFLGRCLLSIKEKTNYEAYEIVLVLDNLPDKAKMSALKDVFQQNLTLLYWDAPFNFSAKVNEGVLASTGDYILLLNDDVEVISPDWIGELVTAANRPGVGVVGAELYFPDGKIQHAGIGFENGIPKHLKYGQEGDLSPDVHTHVTQVDGVTAACALTTRINYFAAGGLSVLLPVNFNDVDFACKLRSLGLTSVVTNGAKLFHFESQTRQPHVHYYERDVMFKRWALLS